MNSDRLTRLEREVALVARQIAGLPVRIAESGGGGATLRKARVTTEITAATSAAEADWGSGEVDICNATTGEPSGTSEAVDNEWPTTFGVDYQVLVDASHSPPRVVGGTCEAQDAATYWGDS